MRKNKNSKRSQNSNDRNYLFQIFCVSQTVSNCSDALSRDVGTNVVLSIHYGIYEGAPQDPWELKDVLSGEIDVCVKPSILE